MDLIGTGLTTDGDLRMGVGFSEEAKLRYCEVEHDKAALISDYYAT